jgi:acyl carrier protein
MSDIKKNTEERLEDIVTEILEIDKEKIRNKKDADFFKDLGADSMLGLEIIAAVERKFDIKIEDEEVRELSTFNNILNFINKKLEQQK